MFAFDEYKTEDTSLMQRVLTENPFATLVTVDNGAAFANHFPLILRANDEPFGMLEGHMSRANPQWKHLAQNAQVVVIFQGPHAYISPSIGVGPQIVPTWNYVAIHVYGKVELVEDDREIIGILARSVAQFEQGTLKPWKMALPQDAMNRMVAQIVGFRIRIERFEPQFKLNQDRNRAERESVAAHLSRSASDNDRTLAHWMAMLSLPLA